MSNNIYAKIIHINDDKTQFVINKGSENNINSIPSYKKFLIVELGDSVIDPDTGENLGVLEIVKGEAKIFHIQEKMTTLISNEHIQTPAMEEVIYKNSRNKTFFGVPVLEQEPSSKIKKQPGKIVKPLVNVKIGDIVKLI
ncbi:hypothetical protein MYG01_21420 [Citrobacter amalonaticus]|uniref:hypothetical protein n=1 Tax=Citrobacter amalonaticus TaxID=35703 RepID=UPI0020BEC821|nr:hypothetical protein [Citrobacter amalonaticus]MCK8154417.1 hypothetical protein [Citrobacter amalonaticus]